MADAQSPLASRAVSTASGFAQCSTHNVRRRAECCEMKPILNADMEVVDYVCVCKPAFACKSVNERQIGGAVGTETRNTARDGDGGVGGVAPPPIINASSTSVAASAAHHRHHGPSSTGAAVAAAEGDVDVRTLFSISFYDASAGAATAAAATPSPTPPSASGDKKKETTTTISDDNSDSSDVDSLDRLPQSGAPVAAAGAAAAVPFPAAPRGRPRYYEPTQNGGAGGDRGGHAAPVKVCWSCGMPGHEKPTCPNTLCRSCHQKRGAYGSPHRCTPLAQPSPFLAPPTPFEWKAMLQDRAGAAAASGMAAVRCVACNEYGHFDCSTVVPLASYALLARSPSTPAAVPHTAQPTCCLCGVRGHTIFDCHQRANVNPDHFERRNMIVADAIRRNGGGSAGAPSSVPAQHYGGNSGGGYGYPSQQRVYGSPTSGGSASQSSSSYTRSGYERSGAGGGQRREREWRDERDQRGGGGGASYNDSYGGERDHQRRRYDAPTFSRAGGSASPSSPSTAVAGRDHFHGGGYQHRHEDRPRDNHAGGGRHSPLGPGHGGHHSHRHDQPSKHNTSQQQQQQQQQHRSSRRGGRRGDSGYDSGDNLF